MAAILSDDDITRISDAVAKKFAKDGAADMAAAAAHKAVQELTVKGLAFAGIDVADKKQIESLKADLTFVRSMRHFCERTGRQVSTALTNAVIWGLIGLLVIGFLFWSKHGGPQPPVVPPQISK